MNALFAISNLTRTEAEAVELLRFKCDICDGKFKQDRSMRSHLETRSGCGVCEKTYTYGREGEWGNLCDLNVIIVVGNLNTAEV